MILFLVSYLGGVLTILSPCILPVLPFVFARADRPFVTSGLPLLLGMAITFAVVATLATVGGGWAVEANKFAFEKDVGNVGQAVKDLKIAYPVAIDSNYAIWRAFNNEYWPAQYFVDAEGRIRHHHFGEGDDARSEQVIQQLVADAGHGGVAHSVVAVAAQGVEEAADIQDINSPETYIGYERAQNFVSPGGAVPDASHVYGAPPSLALNQWALMGDWTVRGENAVLTQAAGSITYRFHARDLHLVLGPSFDGKPPMADHGADIDDQGNGTVTEQRLYQLLRQAGPVTDRAFEIQFLDPGAQAFSFTFG